MKFLKLMVVSPMMTLIPINDFRVPEDLQNMYLPEIEEEGEGENSTTRFSFKSRKSIESEQLPDAWR